MEPLRILWRGEVVGRLERYRPDMSWLEGEFVAEPSPLADSFVHRASSLDPKAVLSDARNGMLATLTPAHPDEAETVVVILALSDGHLCVRRFFHPESVAWVRENVPQ